MILGFRVGRGDGDFIIGFEGGFDFSGEDESRVRTGAEIFYGGGFINLGLKFLKRVEVSGDLFRLVLFTSLGFRFVVI